MSRRAMPHKKLQESETLEFKRSIALLKEGLVSIVAMLNKHGQGELWFGIRDDGVPVGSNIGDKTIRDISQAVAAHIQPAVYPEITTEYIDGLPCIKVACRGAEKPYMAYGRAYMRVGDEDRRLSQDELENLILFKHQNVQGWDREPAPLQKSDLSVAKLKQFVTSCGQKWLSVSATLDTLDLLTADGSLTNAAMLLFAKKQPVRLRCAVFGSESGSIILDRKDFSGDIIELVDTALQYVLQNTHMGMRLEGLRRVDVPEISLPALREAMINAFCHRDYRDPDYVQVAVYPNRVEIRNPGTLFGGLTLEGLRQGNISRRRNPLIAQLLVRNQMIEAWGRGMPLIYENEPGAMFREKGGMFITVFERSATPKTTPIDRGTTLETTPKTTLETTETLNGVTDSELSLLALIAENPKISRKEMATLLSLSLEGVRYRLNKLKRKNKVRHIGSTKAGKWEILP